MARLPYARLLQIEAILRQSDFEMDPEVLARRPVQQLSDFQLYLLISYYYSDQLRPGEDVGDLPAERLLELITESEPNDERR